MDNAFLFWLTHFVLVRIYFDNAFLDNPLNVTIQDFLLSVETDGNCQTGYRLNCEADPAGGPSRHFMYDHSAPGDPWYDSVNNATGYVIEFSMKNAALITSGGVKFVITDGARKWEVHINTNSIDSISGFAVPFTVPWNSMVYYNTYKFCVIGNSFELFVNGTLKTTGTLNVADATKSFLFQSYFTGLGVMMGEVWIQYVKYFLNGNTAPGT